MTENTSNILQKAEETLRTAQMGLDDLKSSQPERRLPGLRNLIVFGRAVTNVVQNLRSTEANFENWYKKFVDQMRDDPLMKHFYNLRSEILKEGETSTSLTINIGHFNSDEIAQYPRPPGATSFFIGDQTGGSGWIVELSNGITEKYYVQLQNDTIETTLSFQNPPNSHLGNDISDKSIEKQCELYLKYLQNLIRDAKNEFLTE